MPCYGCGDSFGFFAKEHGCKNCGFAFCSKCLSKKTKVPKLNDEKHSVCNKCYNILTGKVKPKDDKERFDPPEAYKKRMAALEERESKGDVGRSHHHVQPHHGHQKYQHLNPAEREIAERLEKLKEKTPEQVAAAKVSEKDIASRLANLKGENPDIKAGQSRPYYRPPDRRTQQAQIDDLLDEIADEVELDSRLPDPTKQIEDRLSRLRGVPDTRSSGTENNLNRSDSTEAKPFTHTNIGQDKSKRNNEDGGEISIDEMNKLIQQTADELEMDAKKAMTDLEKDKDIMRRLQEIKSRRKDDVNKQGTPRPEGEQAQSDSDNENEEEMTKNLVKQLLEESKLDEAAARDGIDVGGLNTDRKKSNTAQKEEEIEDDDELPYCTLCTEDATIRCHGCDLDLYCNRCWNESHKEFMMTDHETSSALRQWEKNNQSPDVIRDTEIQPSCPGFAFVHDSASLVVVQANPGHSGWILLLIDLGRGQPE
ncbi:hypothetical protein FSP39_002347 [Pinctada imbricata]|uniref:FYVE-type domain-containing protein n=1 Tax=Pinctada imbricata TaxID=66713 RepID=A0AA88YA09_PINIB|nr:hypothetical protein FSP39_002347 [Pinctada imbricata]